MKRTVVVSDIHGHYQAFLTLLSQIKYEPTQDRLVILGDMIDRGKESMEVVQYLMKLQQQHDVIVLCGNHEELFLRWMDEPFSREHDFLKNGGWHTIKSYCKPYGVYGKTPSTKHTIQRHYQHHLSFLRSLPLYYEDDHAIYVHAGVDLTLADWRQSSPETFRWVREPFWEQKNTTGKRIVFGHTPTYFLHQKDGRTSYDVWTSEDGKIGIDGGYAMDGKLHALCIEENTVYVETITSATCKF